MGVLVTQHTKRDRSTHIKLGLKKVNSTTEELPERDREIGIQDEKLDLRERRREREDGKKKRGMMMIPY